MGVYGTPNIDIEEEFKKEVKQVCHLSH